MTLGESKSKARIAALSAFLGGTLEYYDFLIYGTASALYFGAVFFPNAGARATFLSFATLGVAYISRPIGAIVWGHLGDRIGRKQTLLLTLGLMGVSTFLLGCLPAYASVGELASIGLIVLRLLQGFSAGGEIPGSSALTFESAPDGRSAFFASFATSGSQFGIVLASAIWIPLMAVLSKDEMITWGWRVPFLISIVLSVITLILRRHLQEPEAFVETKEAGRVQRLPLVELFRSSAPSLLRVVVCTFAIVVGPVLAIYGLSYATNVVGVPGTSMLVVFVLSNLVTVLVTPFWGAMADRLGRQRVFAIGSVLSPFAIALFFACVTTKNIVAIGASAVLVSLVFSMPNAVYPSFFAKLFPTRVRYTGTAFGLMIGLLFTGFAPAMATALTASDPKNWLPVAFMVACFSVPAAISALVGGEGESSDRREAGATTEPTGAIDKQVASASYR